MLKDCIIFIYEEYAFFWKIAKCFKQKEFAIFLWKNDLFFIFERFGNLSWRKNDDFFQSKIAYCINERLQVLLFWKIAYSFRMKESAIFQNKRILQSFIVRIRNLSEKDLHSLDTWDWPNLSNIKNQAFFRSNKYPFPKAREQK